MKQTPLILALFCISVVFPAIANAAELGADYTTNLCPTGLDIPARPLVEAELEADDTFATANEADLIENGVSILEGNAEVTRNTQQIRADKIVYDEPGDTADLEGNVHYWDDALFLNSEDAFLTFDNGIGEFENADYILIDSRGRGQADQLMLDVGTRTEMDNVRYTTCDPDDEFWHFTASRLELDHENNWGTARNFVLRIKDIPVFYTPYMSFPLSKERKSGFLAPSYGNTNRHGFQLETPYYWNIAPNMDATFAPRLFTESGVMAIGEFRYMLKQGRGQVNVEYLPSDNLRDDEHRNFIHFDHEHNLFNRGRLSVDYNRVSDKFYFEDFGGQIGLSSTRFLTQRADASYSNASFGHSWNVRTIVHNYQVVDRSIAATSRPYKRLPQVLFNINSPRHNNRINYGIQTESVYFERGDDVVFADDNDNINGLRLHIEPHISYPMRTAATYLTPKLSLDYTQYNLDDSSLFTKSPSRLLPKFSLDGGMFFEREAQLFNRSLTQTLEPKIYYLYVPREDQSDLPVFDTGEYNFDFNSLFRDNRFSGNDRQTDANQVTLAVSSHFLDQETGRDLGNVSVGHILYFSDRRVTLPGSGIRDEDGSAIVAEVNARMIRNWEFGSHIVWDPNVGKSTDRIGLRATYNPEPGKVINMSYRVRRNNNNDIEQSDISFHWPISNKWSAVGRWNYAVPEGRSLETFAGLEYESCCWAARAVARRFLTDINGNFQTGIFFQFELKGLAGIGKKTVDFLRQQIPGYRSEF